MNVSHCVDSSRDRPHTEGIERMVFWGVGDVSVDPSQGLVENILASPDNSFEAFLAVKH